MALFGEKETIPAPVTTPPGARPAPVADAATRAAAEAAADQARRSRAEPKESVIAAELAIEGKIQGAGSVRIAGRFKGDVHVDGNVTVEAGSHLEGGVQAKSVVVGGELTGNIDKAKHVDVLGTGVVVGDVKAETITVAAGARMRGHVEFGWGGESSSGKSMNNGKDHGHA
jgi:cytoskeletal protein CcmA (bactofilin family)